MKRHRIFLSTLLILSLNFTLAVDFKDIVRKRGYNHSKYAPTPNTQDRVFHFRAYTTCFDMEDDDNGDRTPDRWAIPHWVAYQIKEFAGELGKGPKRPSEWITVDDLFHRGITPSDDSYHFSNIWRADNPDSPQLGYDRGHMCMKQHAWRLGENADWNTHTVLNACPQKADLNQGIWLDLENKTAEWADEYGSVWIICGPIIYNKTPSKWLGQEDEIPVAIPDAFFKIIIKENNSTPEVLAFIYPQEGIGYKQSGGYDHIPYLTSVDIIEMLTGLDFLQKLDNQLENEIEQIIQSKLWN